MDKDKKPFELPSLVEDLRLAALEFRGAEVRSDLVGARLADLLRDGGVPVFAADAWNQAFPALDVEGQRRVAVLVATARHLMRWDQVAACLRHRNAIDAFVTFSGREAKLLTLELVVTSPFRAEELARKWVDALGGTIAGESAQQSAVELERLDFGGVLKNLRKAEKEREERTKRLKELEEKRKKEEQEAYARMGRE